MPASARRQALAVTFAVALCAAAVSTHTLSAALTRVSPYLTRAEAAAIVLLASPAKIPPAPSAHAYVDVYSTDWFAPTILAAAKKGILSPDATGTKLKPFGSVNRASFLKMLALAFGLPRYGQHTFSDVPPTSWYAPYAGIEATYGLFQYANASTLEPERLVTQDEARVALDRFLRARSKADDDAAKATAIAQSSGKVQLYTVISTKRLKVVFVPEQRPQSAPTAPSIAVVPSPAPAAHATIDDVRADVLSLVNAARKNAGLPALKRNAALERSAQTYADHMHADGFFGHTDPAGQTLRNRIDAVSYYDRSFSSDCQCIKGYALGENLARGQRSAEEAVKAWMESPSHRDAILGSDFTDLGVGVRSGIWVQHFGGLLMPK